MKMKPVEDSSCFSALGYDAATETLHVEFSHGGRYRVLHVPQAKYDALLAAESKGRHYMREIRHSHQHERVA